MFKLNTEILDIIFMIYWILTMLLGIKSFEIAVISLLCMIGLKIGNK